MDIDIPQLLVRIGVDDKDSLVCREAETVLRLSKAKCQTMEPKQESLRSFVVTDLALAKLGIPFSRHAMMKEAHATDKAYNAVHQLLRNLLGSTVLPRGGTVEQLAIKFPGGTAERSRALLEEFEEVCRSTLTADKRQMLRYDTPLYHAAAFCVASVEARAKISRKSVASEVQVDGQELERICVQIVEKCGLSSCEHVLKSFRVSAPGSDGRGDARAESRKRPAPGSASRDDGGQDNSDVTPTTTRLEQPGSSSPGSPNTTGHSRNMQGMRLFVGAGPRGDASATPAAGAAAPRPPRSADPAMALKEFVKRLRTVTSPAYTRWREKTLASRKVSLPAP